MKEFFNKKLIALPSRQPFAIPYYPSKVFLPIYSQEIKDLKQASDYLTEGRMPDEILNKIGFKIVDGVIKLVSPPEPLTFYKYSIVKQYAELSGLSLDKNINLEKVPPFTFNISKTNTPKDTVVVSDIHLYIDKLMNLFKAIPDDFNFKVVGDLFDRGHDLFMFMDMFSKIRMDTIIAGDHDLLWMGGISGNPKLLMNMIRVAFRYHNEDNFSVLGIDLQPLKQFAKINYPDWESITRDGKSTFKSVAEQALFNIELKLTVKNLLSIPVRSEMMTQELNEKINQLKVINDHGHLLTNSNKNLWDLTPDEEQIYKSLAVQVISNNHLRKLALQLFEHTKLYDVDKGKLYIHAGFPMNEQGQLQPFFNGQYGLDGLDLMQEELDQVHKSLSQFDQWMNDSGMNERIKKEGYSSDVVETVLLHSNSTANNAAVMNDITWNNTVVLRDLKTSQAYYPYLGEYKEPDNSWYQIIDSNNAAVDELLTFLSGQNKQRGGGIVDSIIIGHLADKRADKAIVASAENKVFRVDSRFPDKQGGYLLISKDGSIHSVTSRYDESTGLLVEFEEIK